MRIRRSAKIWISLSLVGFLLGELGCALVPEVKEPVSASVASQRLEPDSELQISRVMVQMPIEDLETRHLTEKSFESLALQARLGTAFLPSHMLFFPGRSYSDDEIAATLRKNDISGVLKISVSGVGATPVYIPRRATTSTSGSSRAAPSATGWSMNGNSRTTTTETGGYYAQAPFANFRLELIDLVSERVIWIATAKTKGEVGVDRSELILSLTRNTLARMNEDRIVQVADGYFSSSGLAHGVVQAINIDGAQRYFDVDVLLTNDPAELFSFERTTPGRRSTVGRRGRRKAQAEPRPERVAENASNTEPKEQELSVRIAGIRVPARDRCGKILKASFSRDKAIDLLVGKKIGIRPNAAGQISLRRTVDIFFEDGAPVLDELITRGLAVRYVPLLAMPSEESDFTRASENIRFELMEATAQNEGIGIWASEGCSISTR